MLKFTARLAIGVVFVSMSAAFARTEHNSFLETPVMSTSALITEVQHDPLVRKRYERQFLMSETELVRYFSSLHVEPLKEDRRYLVFNVDDSMIIRSRMLHLTRGTLVFADATHKPVLKCSCGNPMSAALPAVGENDSFVHSLAGGLIAFTRSAENPGDNEPLVADNTNMMTGEVPSLDETPEIEPPGSRPQPFEPIPTPTPVPIPISGVPPLGFLPLIPLIPLIPIIWHNPGPPPPTPFATPEPASFAPLGLGVLALAWKRRKK
jgi:hypothetical protein